MNFSKFTQMVRLLWQDTCLEIFSDHPEHIKIKKEKTIVKNMDRIFKATLKISNEKGFQAMTMRNLSREAGLSMGALYAYFSSKEDLLEMLQRMGRTITEQVLGECLAVDEDPVEKLGKAIRTHLYLSEVLQPWFYFAYMEAKNLSEKGKERAVASELLTEKIFADIILEGQKKGLFVHQDSRLLAAVIKAMVQDWYVKRWKYAKRNVSVDHYARFLVEFVAAYCLAREPARRSELRGAGDELYR